MTQSTNAMPNTTNKHRPSDLLVAVWHGLHLTQCQAPVASYLCLYVVCVNILRLPPASADPPRTDLYTLQHCGVCDVPGRPARWRLTFSGAGCRYCTCLLWLCGMPCSKPPAVCGLHMPSLSTLLPCPKLLLLLRLPLPALESSAASPMLVCSAQGGTTAAGGAAAWLALFMGLGGGPRWRCSGAIHRLVAAPRFQYSFYMHGRQRVESNSQ